MGRGPACYPVRTPLNGRAEGRGNCQKDRMGSTAGHMKVAFRTFSGQPDNAAGIASGTRSFILQKMLNHGAGIAVSLDDDGADNFAIEIQSVGRQRFLRRNVEELDKAIMLLPDLQFQLLRLYAQLSGIDRTQA